MSWRRWGRYCALVAVWGAFTAMAHAVKWFPMGPYGGHARSFAMDPADSRHIYLGTATGWLYESHDGGDSWTRVSQVNKSDDLVLDHILIDPNNSKHLVVGAFKIDRPDGGLFISDDGGQTFYEQAQMRGQSVRSMARSASDPNTIVAGTLQGIYRSLDDGKHWSLISPAGSTEIHEVESLAIDPKNPNIIYAGTWHLPWKTTDGGLHWENIKQGIIDDSDVFSIIIDPNEPRIVYASACSGIYKSVDAAVEFKKIQGIPSTARRTRKLLQDPSNLQTVYAGTTEGLYKTIDGGATFARMTAPDVIVNDVYVDPNNSMHVLLATERGGVLSSDDGGVAFHPSNQGFSARQVSSYAADAQNPAHIYVGIVNDKQTGGVFESLDGGITWDQHSDGLNGRDVFSLNTTPAGTLLAGTAHGIFRLSDMGWVPSGDVGSVAEKPVVVAARTPRGHAGHSAAVSAPRVHATGATLDTLVYTMVNANNEVLAGTALGLYKASDDGHTWSPVTTLEMPETQFVAVHDSTIMVAGLRRIALSVDGGRKWDPVSLPPDITQVSAIAVDELKNLWVGGREGVYYSTDYGLTWKTIHNLVLTEVNSIYADPAGHQVLVSSSNQWFAFGIHLPDYSVKAWEVGWKLRFLRPLGDHLIGATMFDGMVLQPRMVASKIK